MSLPLTRPSEGCVNTVDIDRPKWWLSELEPALVSLAFSCPREMLKTSLAGSRGKNCPPSMAGLSYTSKLLVEES